MNSRASRPARRHVVVVFIDLVGSTELAERLDPELLRHVLDRYYQACTSGIVEHGGVVEKYIGDAIMATFGIPISKGDDAIRAVRAAHDALARVRDLSDALGHTHGIRLDAHCGISAGEAVVIDLPGADLRVIGDTVNTASRLQSAASGGEILVGEDVARMVRSQARVEPVPPLRLKGKSSPVRAWRLLSPEPDARPREDPTPLIGRAAELERLHEAHRRVVRERRCHVVTLLGAPGIGKSRLVREFLGGLPEETTVLTGRCPSYGVGVTYRPITEMIGSLNGRWPSAAAPMEAASVSALRGLTAGAGPGRSGDGAGVEEISRAVRALFESLARRGPVVAVWEDLQWAETTLLDLIEDLAAWLPDVPVLLVCAARPELADIRPAWCGDRECAVHLELGPLDRPGMERLVAALYTGRAASAEVVAHRVDDLCPRVVDGSDGNPLFAELMLEMLLEEGEDAPLPPTIQALLGARLDRLGDGERDVLERAATIGHVFTADRLRVVFHDGEERRPGLDEPLARLGRHRLIQHGPAPGSYQFTQTLTRDTVYAMTRKELRAAWHLALADHLSGQAEQDDLAHHLEAACRFTREVRPDDPGLPALTERAARALIGEGTHALHRKDLPAAIALLERGRELLPPGDAGHRPLAVRICDAGLARGDRDRAFAALDAAERLLPGDRRNATTCAVQREILAARFGTRPPEPGPLRELLAADPGDDLSWCRLHQLEALVDLDEGRFGAAETALRDGLARAASLGDGYEENRLLSGLCELAQWSPTPIGESLALCADLAARFGGDRALLVPVLITRGRLLALSGDITAARAVLATADRHVRDLHLDLAAAAVVQVQGLVESLAGRHATAEELFRRGAAALRAAGQVGPALTLEAYEARELLRQGRLPEAGRALARLTAEPGGRHARTELLLIALRAGVEARRGEHRAAAALAALALERLGLIDDPCLRGDVLAEIADVHRAAGRTAESADAAGRALRAYAAKGAALPAERVRVRLAAGPGGEEVER
ncbi:AAA family ATPase [Sphaerimonospora mesophila]|uniref:AAA family ATPase n=1 Tax=Sphaerimonospora mesophila TaxID=37483 RepID=UPI0006E2E095